MVCFPAIKWPRLSRKIRNSVGSLQPQLRRRGAQAVQFKISDFEFEVQESSNFRRCEWLRLSRKIRNSVGSLQSRLRRRGAQGSNLRFRISNLRCRNRPISNFQFSKIFFLILPKRGSLLIESILGSTSRIHNDTDPSSNARPNSARALSRISRAS